MSSGGLFSGVGYVDDTQDLDDRYILKETLLLPGDIITLNGITQEPEALPAGPNGYVLASNPALDLGLEWIAPPSEDINPGTPGANTGGSGLTIVEPSANVTQLALSLTGITPGIYGSATQVPQITFDSQGRASSAANVAINPNLVAGTPGAQTGTSGLTLAGGLSVALANSGVTANTYGSSTQIPVITVSGTGVITNVTLTPTVPATDPLASIPTRSFKAASGVTLSVSIDNTAIGDSCQANGIGATVYGSGARANGQGSTSMGHLSGTVGVTGNFCSLYGFQSYAAPGNTNVSAFGAGAGVDGNNGAVFGAGSFCRTNGVCISGYYGSALTGGNNGSVVGFLCLSQGNQVANFGYNNATGSASNSYVFGIANGSNFLSGSYNLILGELNATSLTTGQNNIFTGYNNSTSTNGTNNAILHGSNNQAADNASVFGRTSTALSAGSHVFGNSSTCTNTSSEGLIYGNGNSVSTSNGAIFGHNNTVISNSAFCFGTGNTAGGLNSFTYGHGLTNTSANTQLFGVDSNTRAHFTGFVHSRKSLGAAAGFTAADPSQLINTVLPAQTTLDIQSVRYNNGLNVDLVNDHIQLGSFGTFPLDTESTFLVTASISGTATNAGSAWFLQLMWVSPGFFAAPGTPMAESVMDLANATITNSTIVQTITIPPGTTGENYVYCRMTRIQGIGTATINVYRISVTRIA